MEYFKMEIMQLHDKIRDLNVQIQNLQGDSDSDTNPDVEDLTQGSED